MANMDSENKRLLDVVNENDEIIDSMPRIDAHRIGLLHREVHVWMFDENKNIIFQKRGLHNASAGLLDATAGGHVNKGEDYVEAAVREVKEETSISISPNDLILLKKVRGEERAEDPFGKINNFIRAVYIYNKPVNPHKLKIEPGIPGGNFQKLSIVFLDSEEDTAKKSILPFVVENELPDILTYIK